MAVHPQRSQASPFKRHLAFYDRDGDGLIYFGDSLRANLSLGLDFPVALAGAIGIQSLYGNKRPFFFGPFNIIEIDHVTSVRNMLEQIDVTSAPAEGFDRKALVASSGAQGLLDRMHVNGLWVLAANKQGKLSLADVRRCQQGTIFYDLEKRRQDRADVLPLIRGGPISVAGHSWFVEKLFGVKVIVDTGHNAPTLPLKSSGRLLPTAQRGDLVHKARLCFVCPNETFSIIRRFYAVTLHPKLHLTLQNLVAMSEVTSGNGSSSGCNPSGKRDHHRKSLSPEKPSGGQHAEQKGEDTPPSTSTSTSTPSLEDHSMFREAAPEDLWPPTATTTTTSWSDDILPPSPTASPLIEPPPPPNRSIYPLQSRAGYGITVTPYNDNWPSQFDQIQSHLHTLFTTSTPPALYTAIEHVGSTSIAGLSAKPNIDVLVTFRTPQHMQAGIDALEWEIPTTPPFTRYTRVPRGGGIAGRESFKLYVPPWSPYVHSTPERSVYLVDESAANTAGRILVRGYRAVRDTLRNPANADLLREYGERKVELARFVYDDAITYGRLKNAVIRKVLLRAGWTHDEVDEKERLSDRKWEVDEPPY